MVPRDVQLILGALSSESVIIQGNGSHALQGLSCESHEEADTHIFAHLAYCVQHYGYSHAVIQATDTDILVMAFYQCTYSWSGRTLGAERATYIPCHQIARQLAEKNHLLVTSAISAGRCGHIMSGCDTVSCPFQGGKKKVYKVVMSAAQDKTALTTYGDTDVALSD